METKQQCSLNAKLINFEPQHYPLLMEWIDSDELNYLWGGPQFEYPLTVEQLETHYRKLAPSPFLFGVNDEMVGFIELFKVSDCEQRLCRVFIHPTCRGKGYATTMIELAIAKAKISEGPQSLSLAVFAHNQSAISCYEKLGFKPYETVSGLRFFKGKNWDLIRMSQRI
ncbi:GNAT family N-acetyltransferase [Vibrio sp. C8]